jgi:hypothetical protein
MTSVLGSNKREFFSWALSGDNMLEDNTRENK